MTDNLLSVYEVGNRVGKVGNASFANIIHIESFVPVFIEPEDYSQMLYFQPYIQPFSYKRRYSEVSQEKK
jgi:hypothetical protein